jgi:hypothetical protein
MWLFMTDASLLIVADNDDPRRLLVRAVKAGDIEQVFPDAQVIELEDSDYRFRAFLPRETVAMTVANRLGSIDYAEFTNAVPEPQRRDAYLEVWWQMARWQWQEAVREYTQGRPATKPN